MSGAASQTAERQTGASQEVIQSPKRCILKLDRKEKKQSGNVFANTIPTPHEKRKNSPLIYGSEKCYPSLAVRAY